jgi:hypothetical protein
MKKQITPPVLFSIAGERATWDGEKEKLQH